MLVEDARRLEEAGCCAIVIEGVPWEVAREMTGSVKIPTIGIGAGEFCDGQILVLQDMLGIHDQPLPRFVKTYDKLGKRISSAVGEYIREVKQGDFPKRKHSYSLGKKGKKGRK
jgi:3-methyl-2-oxobutanoate hydroxymethyltransferase